MDEHLIGPADPVGRVLGTEDATPLSFWVALAPEQYLQLDDVVVCQRVVPGREEPVQLSGVVTQVRARHEGARFDSDVFLIEDGQLPAEAVEAAEVVTTRVEPEVFVPPIPGTAVHRATGEARDHALFFDQMPRKLPIGLGRDGRALYANLDFLDGTRGAHVNISGISGVATKTTYATFLLYSVFNSAVLDDEATNTRALVFNVKGEDLLFLDHDNVSLSDTDRDKYRELGLMPGAFKSVAVFAPPRKGDVNARPDVATRTIGVHAFYWTLAEFVGEELLPFLVRGRRRRSPAVHDGRPQRRGRVEAGVAGHHRRRVADRRTHAAHLPRSRRPRHRQGPKRRRHDPPRLGRPRHRHRHRRTRSCGVCSRRNARSTQLVRADIPATARAPHRDRRRPGDGGRPPQPPRPGQALRRRRQCSARPSIARSSPGTSRPLLFVVLDELNKYAPREGDRPIKEILLDVAERGRSLGIMLVGAQQTASEVERRIIANSSIRVVGRLDPAEAARPEYGFLPVTHQKRATIAKPGTMFVMQPEIPVPLVVEFPFPAWATRSVGTRRQPQRDRRVRPARRSVRGIAERTGPVLT